MYYKKKKSKKKIFLSLVLLLVVVLFIGREVVYYQNKSLFEASVSSYTNVPDVNIYQEAWPRWVTPTVPTPRESTQAVIFFHGFPSSPGFYDPLVQALKDKNPSAYLYAPLMGGFGANSLRPLKKATKDQWSFEALQAYDLLSPLAQKITLVGISAGGLYALSVASQRPVDHLVLLSPYLQVAPEEKWPKKILSTPFLSDVFLFALPLAAFPDDRISNDPADATPFKTPYVSYGVFPVKALQQLWFLQDDVQATLKKIEAKSISVFLASHDGIINLQKTQEEIHQVLPQAQITVLDAGHRLIYGPRAPQTIETLANTISHF